MKTSIRILAVSVILITSVVGSIFYYISLVEPSEPDPSDVPSNPSNQLVVNN